jgi:protein SCO1
MLPKFVLVFVAVFSVSATAAITVTVLTRGPAADPTAYFDPAPQRYYPMVDFTLTDQDGRPFGLSDLRGKVWVADTIFTRCNAICPTLTGGMRDIQAQLRQDPRYDEQIRLVSISVDGGHDTPEVLSRYAKAYKADPGRWYFLTGDRETVWSMIGEGLRLAVGDAGPDDSMAISHTGKLVLIDRDGMIRGYYDGLNEAGRAKMLVDFWRVLDEK